MRRIREMILFNKHGIQKAMNTNPFVRIVEEYRRYSRFDPTFLEIFKFQPTSKLFPYKPHLKVFALLLGIQSYLTFTKMYKDDHYIREPGSNLLVEFSYYTCVFRNVRVWVFQFLVLNAEMLIPQDNTSVKHMKLVTRLTQWDNYLKKRDDTFDFLMIGEQEHVPMD